MRKFCFLICMFPLYIYAQENVGIGTSSPQAKLDILNEGDGMQLLRLSSERPWVFKQRGGGSSTRLSLQPTVDNKTFEILSQDGLNRVVEFQTSNIFSNVLLVPDEGEVGIGQIAGENPAARLHIAHNSNTGWPQLRLTEIGYDFARLKMETDADPGTFWDIAARSDSMPENARLNFYFSSPNGGGDRVSISGEGKVGIGTTNPEAKLDIIGGDWNLGAGNPGDLRIGNPTYNFRVGVATGGGGAGTTRLFSQGGSLMLGTQNTAHLTITTQGNVGIGTTNPGNRLRIEGSSTSSAHVLSVSTTYSGNVDIRGYESFAFPATGYGVGGRFEGGYRGVRAYAFGNGSSRQCIALEASAYGTFGTRIGVFGRAVGGSTNWAGYFSEGNVYITNDLRIGSGAANGAAGYKVAIDGKLIAEEVRVQLSGDWPDYVFSEDYILPPLSQLDREIKEAGHLPGIPSAGEIEADGLHLGEMQQKMMEKIEELTLYIIELDKENNRLQARIEQLENQSK